MPKATKKDLLLCSERLVMSLTFVLVLSVASACKPPLASTAFSELATPLPPIAAETEISATTQPLSGYEKHAAVMTGEAREVADLSMFNGEFYLVQVPPREEITFLLPAFCLQYEKQVPGKDAFVASSSAPSAPSPLVSEIILVHDQIAASVDRWIPEIAGLFPLDQIAAEIRTNEAVIAKLTGILANMQRVDTNKNISRSDALQSLRQAVEAMELLRQIDDTVAPQQPVSVRPIDEAEKKQVMIKLLRDALQYAIWREQPAFVEALRKKQNLRKSAKFEVVDHLSKMILDVATDRLVHRRILSDE